jgi:hypothetical protein
VVVGQVGSGVQNPLGRTALPAMAGLPERVIDVLRSWAGGEQFLMLASGARQDRNRLDRDEQATG